MPVAVLTAPSKTSVTSVSISAGAAPVLVVVTETVGMSIFGKRSTPSVKKEKPPMTVSTRMMTVAKTGRLTHISANFCITQNLDLRSGVEVPGRILFRKSAQGSLLLAHARPLVKLFEVARRQRLVGVDAVEYLYRVALLL